QMAKLREQELKLRSALKMILDTSALERLSLVRVSNEALYAKIVSHLFSLFNAGKLKRKVSEEQLKQVALMFISQKKEGTITRFNK
ncbi:MAG: DNA-binding protein, partial [Candidatus Micrarchaeota archaeon]